MTSKRHKDLVGKAISALDKIHEKFIDQDDYEWMTKALVARDNLLLVWREMEGNPNDPTTLRYREEGETIMEVDPKDPNLWPFNRPPEVLGNEWPDNYEPEYPLFNKGYLKRLTESPPHVADEVVKEEGGPPREGIPSEIPEDELPETWWDEKRRIWIRIKEENDRGDT